MAEKDPLFGRFDIFQTRSNLDRNAVKVEHSVYDYIVYDSTTVEKPFALALDRDPDVRMFFKIPERFKIETPIGTYNPDWAVYLTRNGEEKLYFILETTTDISSTWPPAGRPPSGSGLRPNAGTVGSGRDLFYNFFSLEEYINLLEKEHDKRMSKKTMNNAPNVVE